MSARLAIALWPLLGALACGVEDTDLPAPAPPLPFADELIDYNPGPGAGFGQDRLPEVVLGSPQGLGATAGSLDVLSLGVGGEVILGFGDRAIVDGPGPDLLVFENPFWPFADPTQVFAELAEVAVSDDGQRWHSFPCDPAPNPDGRWPGCAGWTPTLPCEGPQPSHEACGGDAFDLASVGLKRARFVRLRDLSTGGAAPSAGFDLDAVAILHDDAQDSRGSFSE
jgi:hypothetical protein